MREVLGRESRGFIDGDLIELFLDLPRPKMEEVCTSGPVCQELWCNAHTRSVSQVVALMSGDGEYRRPPAEGVGLANEPVRTSHHTQHGAGADCAAGRAQEGCSVEELLREVEDVQRIHS